LWPHCLCGCYSSNVVGLESVRASQPALCAYRYGMLCLWPATKTSLHMLAPKLDACWARKCTHVWHVTCATRCLRQPCGSRLPAWSQSQWCNSQCKTDASAAARKEDDTQGNPLASLLPAANRSSDMKQMMQGWLGLSLLNQQGRQSCVGPARRLAAAQRRPLGIFQATDSTRHGHDVSACKQSACPLGRLAKGTRPRMLRASQAYMLAVLNPPHPA